jgi:uncharacterized protein (TIGR00297 family)
MISAASLAAGFAVAIVIAGAAYRFGSLTRSGALAAAVVGGVTFGAGGPLAGLLLILFFVSSSALSRVNPGPKRDAAAHFEKGGRRDQGQVLANGAVAAALAVGYGLTSEPAMMAGLAGALAAANADTWATEIGVLSARRPWLLTSGRVVEPGTSGAVSAAGLLAAVAGAGLIALAAGLGTGSLHAAAAVLVGGFLGAMADSLLGATVQAIYHCPVCDKETERHPLHLCGAATTRIRGWAWLRNDEVNLAASAVGAGAAALIWLLSG